ncbi:hypothetical protein BD309DRAFT_961081 [Dichomitus squalens]|nr:hypothetical protein BD309DRAFT_961081 [Dichomitus squalens]
MAKSHAGTPWSSSQLTHGNNVQSIYSPLLSATSLHVLGQQNLAAAHGSTPYEVSVASGDTLARCALCPDVAAENVVTSLSHLSRLSITRLSFSRPSLSRPSISRPLLPSSPASLTPSSFSQAGTGSITDHVTSSPPITTTNTLSATTVDGGSDTSFDGGATQTSSSTAPTSNMMPPNGSLSQTSALSKSSPNSASANSSSTHADPGNATPALTSSMAPSSSSISTGDLVGIAIGACVFAIGLALIILVYIKKRKRHPLRLRTARLLGIKWWKAVRKLGYRESTSPLRPRSTATSSHDNVFGLVPESRTNIPAGSLVSQLCIADTAPSHSHALAHGEHIASNTPEGRLSDIWNSPTQERTETTTTRERGVTATDMSEHWPEVARARVQWHATDGGVRLAGGRLDEEAVDDVDQESMCEGSILPPPYSSHFG